jgi:hypothetical protein
MVWHYSAKKCAERILTNMQLPVSTTRDVSTNTYICDI